MRRNAKKLALATVLLLLLPLVNGCIVHPCWSECGRAPRMAILHVYVYDYYTMAPIPWATVELYEESWWDWDYKGTWYVNGAGHVVVQGGYMYRDCCEGPDEREFGLEVYASGYYPEWFEIELDYWHPAETVTFFLVPWDDCGDCWTPREGEPQKTPDWDLPDDRIKIGAPSDVDKASEVE